MSGCLHANSMFLFSRIGNGQIGWRIKVENSKKSFKWPKITKNVLIFAIFRLFQSTEFGYFNKSTIFQEPSTIITCFVQFSGIAYNVDGWSWHIWHPKNWLPQSITEKLTVLIDFYTSKRRLKSNWWKNRKNRLFGIRSQCYIYQPI